MKAHCENGIAIAHWLRNHPKVAKVYWPGFEDNAGYAIAKKQMRGCWSTNQTITLNGIEDANDLIEDLNKAIG